MDTQNVVISTQHDVIQQQKGLSIDACHNMDEPPTHYAEWKKPQAKDHILYDSIDMKFPEKTKPLDKSID